MVKIMVPNPMNKWDDLGGGGVKTSLFLETSIYWGCETLPSLPVFPTSDALEDEMVPNLWFHASPFFEGGSCHVKLFRGYAKINVNHHP